MFRHSTFFANRLAALGVYEQAGYVCLLGLALIAALFAAGCAERAGTAALPSSQAEIQPAVPAGVEPARWDRIQAQLAELAYEINGPDQDLWARDKARGLRYRFRDGGLAIGADTDDAPATSWLQLRTVALGRGARKKRIAGSPWRKTGDFTVERKSSGFSEWYRNGGKGLEQGYTLAGRLQGRDPLWIEVEVQGAAVTAKGQDIALTSPDGHTLNYGQLHAVDAKGRPVPGTLQEKDSRHLRLVLDDGQAAYPLSIDPLITGNETITTVAGGGSSATVLPMNNPLGVAVDSAGNLYISDTFNNRIRKVDTTGTISTVAGNGAGGFAGDSGVATSASLLYPRGVAVDGVGNVYIADTNNHRIRKVSSGSISTVAGNGTAAFAGDNGAATSASLYSPFSVALDSAGNLYIADTSNHRIRKINGSGTISTVAGNGTAAFAGDSGVATSASLYSPSSVAVDGSNNLYIADGNNHRIRKVNSSGVISTIAGNGTATFAGDGSAATSASLYYPYGVAVDSGGNLYIADTYNIRIRKVDGSGTISTVAGNGASGFAGDGGAAVATSLCDPYGVAVNSGGNLYIADKCSHRIRKVDTSGVITTVAGNGVAGSATNGFAGDGGVATAAMLSFPRSVALDGSGNLYIADSGNRRVRKADTSGIVTTVAGNGTAGFSGDGGMATSAWLSNPYGVALDSGGNLYIADIGNQRIRKVDSTGIISTVAGNGTATFAGDGGLATSASLYTPYGVAVDGSGNLYIADGNNHRIRKVNSTGIISTVAGNGTAAFAGDGGVATSASLYNPSSVAVDGSNNLYIADGNNHRIRKVNSSGIISTVAGNGSGTFAGDNGAATSASLYNPFSVAVDGSGNLYIADVQNQRIRKMDSSGTISTVAGNGTATFAGDNGAATLASFSAPTGVTVDSAGNLYVADFSNHRIRKVTAGEQVTVSKTGSGSVSSTPSGISCGSTCSASFSIGSSVSLTATPDSSDYEFTGWGGDCSGTGSCSPTIATNTSPSVTATFQGKSRTLTVSKTGTGASLGSVASSTGGVSCGATCSGSVNYGTALTLTATPGNYATFAGWNGGSCSGTASTCVFSMGGDTTISASFTAIPQTLTVTNAGGGSVGSSPTGISCGSTCSYGYNGNTQVTLTATPNTGYSFTGWGGACSGTGTCSIAMDAAKAVTATFVQKRALAVSNAGGGSVSSSPAGISCGGTCSYDFTNGASVTLTATPSTGYTFSGWSGACSGSGATCTLAMDAAKSVTASFALNQTLAVSNSGGGSVSSSPAGISCGGTCNYDFSNGTSVALTATPSTGYTFSGWSGACSGSGATCTLAMDAAKSVTASFALNQTLTVSNAGGGSIGSSPGGISCGATCSYGFTSGTLVTLTAIPATGYTFAGWSGACTGAGNTCNVAMSTARTVTASFAQNQTLTVSNTGGGSVSSSPAGISCGGTCSYGFTHGSSVALTAIPATGYTFAGWSDACAGTGSCSVAMDSAKSVTATFQKNQTLTVSNTGGGTVNSTPNGISCGETCSQEFAGGSLVSLAATPDAGFSFAGWSGACAGTENCNVTMDSAKSVAATFVPAKTSVELTVLKNGEGKIVGTPGGISCGRKCGASVDRDTTINLSAKAAKKYQFTGWDGGGCSGTDNCQISMDDDQTVTATFTRLYRLTVKKRGKGTVSGSSANYLAGSTVTLTATPAAGYAFMGWNGTCDGTDVCNVTVDDDVSVTAIFQKLPR